MAAPGESLLLRAGLVRPEQLAEAQRLRGRNGGTTGEWLVRLGAVTEQQLVEFYHLRLLVPRVTGAQLQRVPADALDAVPPDMATEFRVFPVSLDAQRALLLAMADPSDTHVAEEVAFYTGRACHRAVAAVSDILGAIDRHYRKRTASWTGFPPPIPVLPDLDPPARTPAAEVFLLTQRKDDPAPLTDEAVPETSTRESSASRRSRAITQSRLPPPPGEGPSPPPAPAAEAPSNPASGEEPRGRVRTLPGLPVTPELPLAGLRAARSRDEVAAALLSYGAQLAPASALLVMRKGALAALEGRGVTTPEALRACVLSVEDPSLVRDVVRSRLPWRGALQPPEVPAHRRLLELAGDLPGDVLLLPISVGERVIAVFFAAGVTAVVTELAMRDLMHEAGHAYERLILTSKR